MVSKRPTCWIAVSPVRVQHEEPRGGGEETGAAVWQTPSRKRDETEPPGASSSAAGICRPGIQVCRSVPDRRCAARRFVDCRSGGDGGSAEWITWYHWTSGGGSARLDPAMGEFGKFDQVPKYRRGCVDGEVCGVSAALRVFLSRPALVRYEARGGSCCYYCAVAAFAGRCVLLDMVVPQPSARVRKPFVLCYACRLRFPWDDDDAELSGYKRRGACARQWKPHAQSAPLMLVDAASRESAMHIISPLARVVGCVHGKAEEGGHVRAIYIYLSSTRALVGSSPGSPSTCPPYYPPPLRLAR